ncbi:hypothetical protein A2U01_0107437, partial [Trifolium medium]|nr:hypothetical protein [Trifolium medium]
SARRAGEDGAARQSVGVMVQELSDVGASRRFIRRIAHLHVYFARVAQTG